MHIKVVYVTHLFELANGFYEDQMENAIYLRAERKADGKRTFKVIEGKPLQTSFGRDVYNKVFGKGKLKQEALRTWQPHLPELESLSSDEARLH